MKEYLRIEIISIYKSKLIWIYILLIVIWTLSLSITPYSLLFNIMDVIFLILIFLFYNSIKKFDTIGEIIFYKNAPKLIINGIKYNLKDFSYFMIDIEGYTNQIKIIGRWPTFLTGLNNTIDYSYEGERQEFYFRLKNRKQYKELKNYMKNKPSLI